VTCADPTPPLLATENEPAAAPALDRSLVRVARFGALAHAALVPISIAGMQIALGVALAPLVALRLRGHRVWARSPVDAPALLFTGAAVLSIALASLAGSTPVGWHGATLWRSFLSPLVLVSALALELPGEPPGGTRRRALTALSVWAGAAVLPSLWAWVQVPTGLDLIHLLGLRSEPYAAPAPRYPGHFAASGFFWWYTVFAHNLTPPLAVAAAVALHGGLPPRRRRWLLAAVAAIVPAIALSFSRAAWVAIAAAALVIVLHGGRAFVRWALPLTAGGLVAIAALQPGLRNRLTDALSLSANGDRMNIWGVCAAVVREYPLTGVGWGNLHGRVSDWYDRLAPWAGVRAGCHDIFFTALAEGGPLLLTAAALYWALLFRGFGRARRTGDALAGAAAAGAIAASVATLVNGLVHDVFYSSEPMYGLGLALALAAALARPGAAAAPSRRAA
jgi:O-antigen ligase